MLLFKHQADFVQILICRREEMSYGRQKSKKQGKAQEKAKRQEGTEEG
jgi:hypothetical protein